MKTLYYTVYPLQNNDQLTGSKEVSVYEIREHKPVKVLEFTVDNNEDTKKAIIRVWQNITLELL